MENGYEIAQNTPSFKKIEVSSVLFSEYKCLEERAVFPAWSHLNYFIYVLEGKKKWCTLENSYMVHPNEVLFVKKGANIIHKYFDVDFCALVIFIPDGYIRSLILNDINLGSNILHQPSDSVIPLKLDQTLDAYFASLLSYFYNDTEPSTQLLELKFKELLINILTMPTNPMIGAHFMEIAQNLRPDLKSIMEANFIYNLSMTDFAKLTNRSLSTFHRDFHEVFGVSPGKWLYKKRLQHAKRLLEMTDKKVFQVAFECGFENPSHFHRSFKKENGITPLKFQKAKQLV